MKDSNEPHKMSIRTNQARTQLDSATGEAKRAQDEFMARARKELIRKVLSESSRRIEADIRAAGEALPLNPFSPFVLPSMSVRIEGGKMVMGSIAPPPDKGSK